MTSTTQRALLTAARIALISAAILIAPVSAPADEPQKPSDNPAVAQRAQTIIEKALATYRAAKTYHDQPQVHFELVATDKDGNDVGENEERPASAAYARPNRLALVTDEYTLHCDGKQLWLFSGMMDQYTQETAPDKLDLTQLAERMMAGVPLHPVLHVLTQPEKSFQELYPMVQQFSAVTEEQLDGRPGLRMAGTLDATGTPFAAGAKSIPVTLWFDSKTALLGQLHLDFTKLIRKQLGLTGDSQRPPPDMPGMPRHVERAGLTITFRDATLDAAIPAERFVFKPPQGAEKVSEFSHAGSMQMPDPTKLVGQPAPAFSGTGFDGKPLSLESLRGRVVMLDFWATWCQPCIIAIPSIQKIHEKYADQPMTVIGVNQDAPGQQDKAKKFVADKKLTFRQFPDSKGKLGMKYKVAGIPCTFLIGKQGKVQAVHVGYSPNLEKELAAQIERLLKGEDLFSTK